MKHAGWLPRLAALAAVALMVDAARAGLDEVCYWEAPRMRVVKSFPAERSEEVRDALKRVRSEAEIALRRGPFSVMDKADVPPSGDKHDYLSFSRYWWPDPDSPDGLPYIRRDGRTNVALRARGDRDSIGMLFDSVQPLALAYYFFDDEKYAEHAALLIRTWFLDPQTRMNPHLNYGQAVPGRSEGRGVGVIDTRGFILLLDAVEVISASPSFTQDDRRALQEWFREYLAWLRESELAGEEAEAENNHGSWYAAQTARIAIFVDAPEIAREIVLDVRDRRIDTQFRGDGGQPEEEQRTKSLHYSFFNLSALSALARAGERLGVNVWEARGEDDGGMRQAFEYLLPYLTDQEAWPHEQLDRYQLDPHINAMLRMASIRYDDAAYYQVIERVPHRRESENYAALTFAARTKSDEDYRSARVQALEQSYEPPIPAALPDLDEFTVERVRALVPKMQPGKSAVIAADPRSPLLRELLRADRGRNLQRRQQRDEIQMIEVSAGVVRLEELVKQIADPALAERQDRVVTLRIPLLIAADAALVVDGRATSEVRLSTDRGAFVVNAGTLLVCDSEVTAWDEDPGRPTPFADEDAFRPYVTSYIRSRTYFANSIFRNLGYHATSSYGITLSSQPERNRGPASDDWPTGILVGNEFHGLYYGFYSFEARDTAIVDNRYVDCIRYGIDPHDRSTRLIIARNTVSGTVERHGIIGSREVSDSFIFENESRGNGGSGIMLDRNCTDNVVRGNRVFGNEQGIALYESPDNVLENNLIYQNAKSGIRVRNSRRVLLRDNTIVGNGDYGLELYSKRLDDFVERWSRGDYYRLGTSLRSVGDTISRNENGLLKSNRVDYLMLSDVATTDDGQLDDADFPAETATDPFACGGHLKKLTTAIRSALSSHDGVEIVATPDAEAD